MADTFRPVNIKKLLSKYGSQSSQYERAPGYSSFFFDPHDTHYSVYGNLRCADRAQFGDVSCDTLRRVSKKAFIINICINHVLKKMKPFLKPSTTTNQRGFVVVKDGNSAAPGKGGGTEKEIERFIMSTGLTDDSGRDNFQRFALKILRDCLEIDQVATEIGFRRNGKPCSFHAVDAATILKVIPGQHNPDDIEFIQVIDGIPQAYFPKGTIVFDFLNPRTDVHHPFYGYSYVDQVIDLVTASINTFAYNAGFFTENKLPRGMLLVDGNVSDATIESMEDYIADMMSGGPAGQWKVPIIPSGGTGDNSRSISWVPLGNTSREMEFQQWMDYQTSCIVAMFGCSMDELGLQSNKSQALFEHQGSTQIKAAKSTILGDMLSFLQDYMTRIIGVFYPGYRLEFVGYETEDPKALVDLASAELSSYRTLNEVRKDRGYEELDSEWANIPLNPQAVQLYNSAKMQEQSGGGMGGLEDMGMEDGGYSPEEDNEEQGDDFGEEDLVEDTEAKVERVDELGKSLRFEI